MNAYSVVAEAILKWGATLRACWGRGSHGSVPSPENFEFFDLEMACFHVFCGAKFNIMVTTNSCKNTKCMRNESGCDTEKQLNICCHFL